MAMALAMRSDNEVIVCCCVLWGMFEAEYCGEVGKLKKQPEDSRMSVAGYRGVAQEQDPRFAEKQKKQLASTGERRWW
jgi:hypothetical protein